VYKLFDPEGEFDLAPAIESLSCTAFVGLEGGKLGFPESKNVGFYAANFCDISNPEVEAVWNLSRSRKALLGGLGSHPNLRNGMFQKLTQIPGKVASSA
jgi:hypothetical protein